MIFKDGFVNEGGEKEGEKWWKEGEKEIMG